jgi:sugar phosphate isomerase/epimerase
MNSAVENAVTRRDFVRTAGYAGALAAGLGAPGTAGIARTQQTGDGAAGQPTERGHAGRSEPPGGGSAAGAGVVFAVRPDARALAAEKIRIGTLVSAQVKGGPANYIRQILPLGFESFSLTFWQQIGDVDLPQTAAEIREVLGDTGVVLSSVSVYGNPLMDNEKAQATRAGWEQLIDGAHLFGCNIVTGFAGRVVDRPVPESMKRFGEVFGPLAKRAADRGVRLAFENCEMGGDWQRGDWNIAHNPVAWELMFNEVKLDNIGLQWEPAHQMVALIDPLPQLRKWVRRVFHVHGKDATVHWDVIREYGVQGCRPWVFHRTPGFGDINWTDVISILRGGGFTGSIDIEGWHDPVYKDDLEMTGQAASLQYLKRCRGGSFVPNPT